MYFIVNCTPLNDQWECDARKTPVCIVSDWRQWYQINKPDYRFEVWEVFDDNGNLQCIKEWDEPIKSGMALVYYEDGFDFDEPYLVKKYKDRTRDSEIPKQVSEYIKQANEVDNWLSSCGYITFTYNNKLYAYVEYSDDEFYPPC